MELLDTISVTANDGRPDRISFAMQSIRKGGENVKTRVLGTLKEQFGSRWPPDIVTIDDTIPELGRGEGYCTPR